MILIDNVNVLFEKKSYISKVGNKRKYGALPKGYIEDSIDMEEISIVPNLKKLLVAGSWICWDIWIKYLKPRYHEWFQKGDYPNAAAIVSVDRTAKLLYDNGYLNVNLKNQIGIW